MSTENALLTILVEKINNDTLVLPTLPAIALQVRQAADDPDINLSAMSDVIGKDPSLSARMIRISNSAYLGRSVKVESLNQAVTRIGLRQIKTVATALAMEQLFVSKNAIVKELLDKAWNNTVDVTAYALAALQHYQSHSKDRTLTLETLTLSGLIHNIGILPVLTEAERHEEVFGNPSFINIAIQKLSGQIGAVIMKEWGFGDEFVNVAKHWRDLQQQCDNVTYIDFIRLGAVLAGQLDNHKDTVLNLCQQKGMVADLSALKEETFVEMFNEAKAVFS